MRYKKINEYTCSTLAEVQAATENLDKAIEVPIKIDDGGVIKDIDNFKGIYNVKNNGKSYVSFL